MRVTKDFVRVTQMIVNIKGWIVAMTQRIVWVEQQLQNNNNNIYFIDPTSISCDTNEVVMYIKCKICKKYDTKDGNDNTCTLFYVGISLTCWTVTCSWELFYSEKWFCLRDGRNVCDWQIAEVVSGCLAGVMCFSQSSSHSWSKDQTLYRLCGYWLNYEPQTGKSEHSTGNSQYHRVNNYCNRTNYTHDTSDWKHDRMNSGYTYCKK